MKIEEARYVSFHRWAFKPGEFAKILGVVVVTPDGGDPRPCYQLRYPDGTLDVVPIFDPCGYNIQTLARSSAGLPTIPCSGDARERFAADVMATGRDGSS